MIAQPEQEGSSKESNNLREVDGLTAHPANQLSISQISGATFRNRTKPISHHSDHSSKAAQESTQLANARLWHFHGSFHVLNHLFWDLLLHILHLRRDRNTPVPEVEANLRSKVRPRCTKCLGNTPRISITCSGKTWFCITLFVFFCV